MCTRKLLPVRVGIISQPGKKRHFFCHVRQRICGLRCDDRPLSGDSFRRRPHGRGETHTALVAVTGAAGHFLVGCGARIRCAPGAAPIPGGAARLARLEHLVTSVFHTLLVAILHGLKQLPLVKLVPTAVPTEIQAADVHFGTVYTVHIPQKLVKDGLQATWYRRRDLIRPAEIQSLGAAKHVHDAAHGPLHCVCPASKALGERGVGPFLDLLCHPLHDGCVSKRRFDGFRHPGVLGQGGQLSRLKRGAVDIEGLLGL
mmetsp:Transcript_14202/g.40526  ORF Transcript_14202/g.40526 Transcript_14202/m.40526 type:complete len:258 (-) Transcript_14202:5027-5800(-)